MKVPVINDVCPCCMMDGASASPWVLVGRWLRGTLWPGQEQGGHCDVIEISDIMG